MPQITSFIQEGNSAQFGEINALTVLTVEEYEVIRLIDQEGLTQEECALQMEVSRPTVQILYNDARKKVAKFLTGGGRLQIEGGSYKVCSEDNGLCRERRCDRPDERGGMRGGHGRGRGGGGRGRGQNRMEEE